MYSIGVLLYVLVIVLVRMGVLFQREKNACATQLVRRACVCAHDCACACVSVPVCMRMFMCLYMGMWMCMWGGVFIFMCAFGCTLALSFDEHLSNVIFFLMYSIKTRFIPINI